MAMLNNQRVNVINILHYDPWCTFPEWSLCRSSSGCLPPCRDCNPSLGSWAWRTAGPKCYRLRRWHPPPCKAWLQGYGCKPFQHTQKKKKNIRILVLFQLQASWHRPGEAVQAPAHPSWTLNSAAGGGWSSPRVGLGTYSHFFYLTPTQTKKETPRVISYPPGFGCLKSTSNPLPPPPPPLPPTPSPTNFLDSNECPRFFVWLNGYKRLKHIIVSPVKIEN